MLFNSLEFALFLPLVFFLYWFATGNNLRLQNLLIVVASYFFYGWWDWRFLSLLLVSTLVDYTVGLRLLSTQDPTRRKLLLWTSIVMNLGILGVFKYYNFFVESFATAFTFLGMDINPRTLDVILPVGISFYTFQTMSYTIDVYKGRLAAGRDLIAFSAYVSFFPQLVAGPIERATNLLPQFSIRRRFVYSEAVDGMRQILWGLFKKIVIADNCAEYANLIFNGSGSYSGSTLALGALFFTFQIYGDFSGYSDIAIGTARLFGFRLMRNFDFPYFSRDIAEFWRRWHISLSTWFRDYLYVPLGGSHGGSTARVRNIFIIFLVSGFWHGANWTFIVWGLLNALYFLPLLLSGKNRNNLGPVAPGRFLPDMGDAVRILITFTLTVLAWIFFRARSLTHAFEYISGILSSSLFSVPDFEGRKQALPVLVLIAGFVLLEWIGREQQFAIAKTGHNWGRPARWLFYMSLIALGFIFSGKEQQFIYFQF